MIGYGAIAQSVSHGSTAAIAATAPTNANSVPARLMAPNPTTDFTADTSLVARVIVSPVVLAASSAGRNDCTLA